MLISFLLLPMISATMHLMPSRFFEKYCFLSICCSIVFLFLVVYQWLNHPFFTHPLVLRLLEIDHIDLTLHFIADKLTLIMLLLIGLVSVMVNLYASRYIFSDLHRSRFMMQLALVTFSVTFLAMSGNLLTAFIGWQLIGFNLYWLLNHYHYDECANRSAKKKFVINRLGDMFFLLAVILSLHFYSSTEFSVILSGHSLVLNIFYVEITVRTLILVCLFVAVMTKSAQFPFHIWLPDTMQAPTPVSAIMHAGIINAGGFLLARLAPGLLLSPVLLGVISVVGFITVVVGALFTTTQPDVKKQLAYSTMSQMGYMVLQCGLGCFSGALFHLVGHGFYKAYSFLNSGNQLFSVSKKNNSSLFATKNSIVIGLVVLFVFLLMIKAGSFTQLLSAYPLLMMFVFITALQLTINIWGRSAKIGNKLVSSFLMLFIFAIYIKIVNVNDFGMGITQDIRKSALLSIVLQTMGMFVIVFFVDMNFLLDKIHSKKIFNFIINKMYIELFYRVFLLNPMRRFGDKIYKLFLSHYYFLFFLAIFLILSSVFSYGFIARMCVTAVSCVLLILLLLAANRAARIRDVVLCVIFSQYSLGVIASQLSTSVSRVIAIYQIINTTLISLLFFYFLSKIKICKIDECFKKNNLPWLATYFSAGLFLSIGLPFTSTFISEILIMREMMVFNPVFVVVLMVAMFLFTVSVLHALQDYVFKEKSIRRFSIRLSFFDHSVFCFLILFNVIGGIFPSIFINAISTGVQSL